VLGISFRKWRKGVLLIVCSTRVLLVILAAKKNFTQIGKAEQRVPKEAY